MAMWRLTRNLGQLRKDAQFDWGISVLHGLSKKFNLPIYEFAIRCDMGEHYTERNKRLAAEDRLAELSMAMAKPMPETVPETEVPAEVPEAEVSA